MSGVFVFPLLKYDNSKFLLQSLDLRIFFPNESWGENICGFERETDFGDVGDEITGVRNNRNQICLLSAWCAISEIKDNNKKTLAFLFYF